MYVILALQKPFDLSFIPRSLIFVHDKKICNQTCHNFFQRRLTQFISAQC